MLPSTIVLVKLIIYFRYDFVLHANKGEDSDCQGHCGERNEEFKRFLSEGIFRIRFSGYMVCASFKTHQEALLIYNKKGEEPNKLKVHRSVSAAKLSSILPKSLEYKTFKQDQRDPKMLPVMNAPNYAPYSGGSFREANFVALNELNSCVTKRCNHNKGMF